MYVVSYRRFIIFKYINYNFYIKLGSFEKIHQKTFFFLFFPFFISMQLYIDHFLWYILAVHTIDADFLVHLLIHFIFGIIPLFLLLLVHLGGAVDGTSCSSSKMWYRQQVEKLQIYCQYHILLAVPPSAPPKIPAVQIKVEL